MGVLIAFEHSNYVLVTTRVARGDGDHHNNGHNGKL